MYIERFIFQDWKFIQLFQNKIKRIPVLLVQTGVQGPNTEKMENNTEKKKLNTEKHKRKFPIFYGNLLSKKETKTEKFVYIVTKC